MFDSIEEAMYHMVHDFKGGAGKIAARTNMNSGTLQNKVNPTMEGHHLTFKEAINIMATTQDFRLLYAACAELGHACVPMDDEHGVSDLEFLTQFSASMAEVGELSLAIKDAFADGRISKREVSMVHKEALDAIAAIAKLPTRMAGMSDE
ncbi:MAG: hypothetical protein COA83_09780 [Methylophaga sp.]|nr:MAG: hypothetical protein COA83_09780 [Methylophaga sp.]